MTRERDLLLALAESISRAWHRAGFSSRDEAEKTLRELADSLERSGGTASNDRIEVDGGRLGIVLYVDGASRGNPGPSSVGVVAYLPGGDELTSISKAIGTATNNVAEYTAVLEGLRLASRLRASDVEVRLDSELVARQLNGEYRIKNSNLKALFRSVISEAARFGSCRYVHIPRAENARADELANEALDVERDGS